MLMLRKIIAALLCALCFAGCSARAADPAETAYIRDALVKQGLEKGLDKSPQLEKLVTEFRNEQLARLALEAARDEGCPISPPVPKKFTRHVWIRHTACLCACGCGYWNCVSPRARRLKRLTS